MLYLHNFERTLPEC